MYVTYDIRGVHRYLTLTPKLRLMIGGSALIVEFDDFVRKMEGRQYSAAGHGAILTADPDGVRSRLRAKAHANGMDLRLGQGATLDEALDATQDYPFVPENLAGPPCKTSGLYPTRIVGGVHPVIQKREGAKDLLSDRMHGWDALNADLHDIGHLKVPKDIENHGVWDFFKIVGTSADDPDSATFRGMAAASAKALGGRNRWAIIAMDGNRIGQHFQAKTSPEKVQARSRVLTRLTWRAVLSGLGAVLEGWAGLGSLDAATWKDHDGTCRLVLPVRPLVVGGDDILLLCHPSFAMDFVTAAMDAFEAVPKDEAPLFEATGGKVTISAGILFTGVTFPLHRGIKLAEELLKRAKRRSRELQSQDDGATKPEGISCVDWESVTDGLVESIDARRRRTLEFVDGDTGAPVSLTRRPCPLNEVRSHVRPLIDELEKLPRSLLHRFLRGLRASNWDRVAWRAEIGRHRPELADLLREDGNSWKRQKRNGTEWLTTYAIDAWLLCKERQRQDITGGRP